MKREIPHRSESRKGKFENVGFVCWMVLISRLRDGMDRSGKGINFKAAFDLVSRDANLAIQTNNEYALFTFTDTSYYYNVSKTKSNDSE